MKLSNLVALFSALVLSVFLSGAKPADRDSKGLGELNLLENPGFENGLTRYTASAGAFTLDTTAGEIGFGYASGKWDPSASSQTLSTSLYAPAVYMYGKPCLAQFKYYWPGGTSGDLTANVEDNTAAELVGTDLTLEVSASGIWSTAQLAFVCPSSGTIRIKLTSTANTSAIILDEFHLGTDIRQVELSQSTVVARAYFATTTNCSSWTRTNTALGVVGTDTDCPAITVGYAAQNVTINAADTDLPQLVFSTLPPGNYEVYAQFTSEAGAATGQQYALYDGSAYIAQLADTPTATSAFRPYTLVGFAAHTGGAKLLQFIARQHRPPAAFETELAASS